VIFNRVICSSWKHLCHLSPFVTVSCVGQKQNPLLMWHPFHLKNTRI
jgi:hypothetical protein